MMVATLVIGGMVPAYEEPYIDACFVVEKAQKAHWVAAMKNGVDFFDATDAAEKAHPWPDREAYRAKHPGMVAYVPPHKRPGWKGTAIASGKIGAVHRSAGPDAYKPAPCLPSARRAKEARDVPKR